MSEPGFVAARIDDIERAPDSTIWISCKVRQKKTRETTSGQEPRLYYLQHDSLKFMPFSGLIPGSATETTKFAFDRSNRLWVSVFGEQLYGYDFADSTVFLISSENSNIPHERFMRDPFVDHEDGVWIPGPVSAGTGLYRYDNSSGVRHFLHPFAFDQLVSAIGSVNHEMWFAYVENGVVRVGRDQPQVRRLSGDASDAGLLPSDHVVAITQLQNGKVAMASFGLLTLYDPINSKAVRRRIRGTCRAVFEDSKQRLWVGGHFGIIQFTQEGEFIKRYSLPPALWQFE